jgi:hypothetical protein
MSHILNLHTRNPNIRTSIDESNMMSMSLISIAEKSVCIDELSSVAYPGAIETPISCAVSEP